MVPPRPTLRWFSARCPYCLQRYQVEQEHRVGLREFLRRGPRCINTVTTHLGTEEQCGARLVESQWSHSRDDVKVVRMSELVGYRVIRLGDAANGTSLEQKLAIARAEVVKLTNELAQLRAQYQTPCAGLVKHYEHDVITIVSCGGFLGHPGDCAEVW